MAFDDLRDWMFEHMYLTPTVRNEFEKAQQVLIALFEYVMKHPEQFMDTKSDEPLDRLAIDFIAGMTDHYALDLYTHIFLPKPWSVK